MYGNESNLLSLSCGTSNSGSDIFKVDTVIIEYGFIVTEYLPFSGVTVEIFLK